MAATLAGIQACAFFAFIEPPVSAQSNQEVMLVVGEKSRDACEVQYRRSDNGNWGANSIMGPPEACEGGLVVAYRTTQQEASQMVARSTSDSNSTEVRVVPLTGNDAADEAAFQAEMASIHELFDPGEPDGGQSLQTACDNGQDVGTWRREDFNIRANGVRTRVEGSVYYRRVSCAKWRITSLEMTPSREPRNNLWFRNFFYRSTVDNLEAGKQCWLMHDDETTIFNPNWQIRARGRAEVEIVDANPNAPGVIPSCYWGAGTSYTSGAFRLPGGTR